MAKSKRDEDDDKGDGYEFKLPDFDEKAFIRREVLSARASFVSLGVGAAGGVLAVVLYFIPGLAWEWGLIPLFASVAFLGRALRGMGFPEEVTAPKALLGTAFMVFFTGLAVWILGINLV